MIEWGHKMSKTACEVAPVKETTGEDEVKLYTDGAVVRLTGTIPHHFKTDVTNLFGNRYRINVWSEERRPDRLFSHYKITKSFFAYLEDGEFVDKTIAAKIKPGQKMNIFS
tara:strand:- start:596 stop:928 length:333 start_codon:yes stop_codon:yes gene_type:complete